MRRPTGIERSDDFQDERFCDLELDEPVLAGKEFESCEFRRCSLTSADLSDCAFRETTFDDCDLSGARFADSKLVSTVFSDCKLIGIDWTSVHVSRLPLALTFERCRMDFSSFAGLRLAGSGFRHCRLHEADFSDADLSGCDFGRADLARARFANTDIEGARLDGAINYHIDVRTNRVKGARVSLPEGMTLLQAVGIVVVEFEEPAAGEPPAA
jgi:fluoroquinolone resistance protein